MVSLAMAIGMSLMVLSFRHTVADWVDTTISADLYIAPATGFPATSAPACPRCGAICAQFAQPAQHRHHPQHQDADRQAAGSHRSQRTAVAAFRASATCALSKPQTEWRMRFVLSLRIVVS
jgi:hypothetical protein